MERPYGGYSTIKVTDFHRNPMHFGCFIMYESLGGYSKSCLQIARDMPVGRAAVLQNEQGQFILTARFPLASWRLSQ